MKIFMFAFTLLASSCLSTARLSDFPESSTDVPFEDLKTRENHQGDFIWTFDFKDGRDYHILLSGQTEPETVKVIQDALTSYGYRLFETDTIKKRVIGKRGLHLNEWNSICAIYYSIDQTETQIYIMSKITQDFTGGFDYNLAEEIGKAIFKSSQNCKKLK